MSKPAPTKYYIGSEARAELIERGAVLCAVTAKPVSRDDVPLYTQPAAGVTESQIAKTRDLTLGYAAMHFDAKNGKMVNSAYVVEYLTGLKEAPIDALVITGQPVAAQGEQDVLSDEALREAVAEGLRGLYGCGRVWSAWNVGTMGEDDFYPAEESDECITQVADAVRAAILAAKGGAQ